MITPVRRYALPALSGAALLFSLFVGLAGVATAHSGSIVAKETCTTWSVTVSLDNNVTADRTVDVVSTIVSAPGFSGGHFDSSYGQIWQASGAAPATGTVTLDIYDGANLEFTTSTSIAPVVGCGNGGPSGQSSSPGGDASQSAAPASPGSPSPVVTEPAAVKLTLIKVLCPSYSVVPANKNPTTYDATGGHGGQLDKSYQTALVDPTTDIPASCKNADGWQFGLFGGWSNGSLSPQVGPLLTTGADGAGTGAVTVTLDAYEQGLAALTSTPGGVGLWVAEVEQPSVATFGALRCYTDINNGDNVENIAGLTGSAQHIYCIAYNVLPNAAPSPTAFQSFEGATATAFQSFEGATATAAVGPTPPPTNTGANSPDRGSAPLVFILIGLASGWLGLVAVKSRRGSLS